MGSSFVRRKLAEPHEVLEAAVRRYARKAGIGVAGQAALISQQVGRPISMSLAYKWLEGQRPIPLDAWLVVAQFTGDPDMPRYLAAAHGGLFVELPPDDAGDSEEVLRLIADFSGAAEEAAKALEDGVVTRGEYDRCEALLDDAITTTIRLKSHLHNKAQSNGRSTTLREAQARHAGGR